MKMEFSEISVKDSPGLCRCCLSEGCYKDMGTEYTWMNETEVYADMLLDCFDVGITQHNDGPNGPKRLICEVCITRLRDACNFKKQVLDSEKKFIDMLGRGEFRSKVLIYQDQLKSEAVEVSLDDMDTAAEVEYLDDIDFQPDDMEPLSTIKRELPSSSSTDAPRKRGRPRKDTTEPQEKKIKKTDVKKTKITKGLPESRSKTNRRKLAKPVPTTTDNISILDVCIKIEDGNVGEDPKTKSKMPEIRTNISNLLNSCTAIPFLYSRSSFHCFFCKETFRKCNELQNHYSIRHREENCNPNGSYMKKLHRNSFVKVDNANLKCKLCQKPFENLDTIIDHLIDDHGIVYDKNLPSILLEFKLYNDNLCCVLCRQKFQFFNKLASHMIAVHENKLFVCYKCGKAFRHQAGYSHHLALAHGPGFPCRECGKKCSSKTHLREHMAQVHGKYKLKCQECDEEFKSHYKRKQHLVSVHNVSLYSFPCTDCSKVFVSASNLNVHKRQIHLQEKSVRCSICDVELFDKSRLNVHMVKHLKERNHVCDICGKKFQWKKNLKRHMFKVHNIGLK